MAVTDYSVGMAKLYWMGTATASTNTLYNLLKANPNTGAAPYSFGNIVAAEIAPAITYLDHFISYKGDKRKDKSVAIQKSISVPFTFDEINATNLAKFFYASSLGSGKWNVMGSTNIPQEGTAILFFTTDVGRDFMYVIPRAAMKSEGGLPFNMDGWMQGKFTLEVLFSSTYNASGGSVAAPYGFLDMTAVATVAPG